MPGVAKYALTGIVSLFGAVVLAAAGPTLDLALALNTSSTATLAPLLGITIPNLGALDIGGRCVPTTHDRRVSP